MGCEMSKPGWLRTVCCGLTLVSLTGRLAQAEIQIFSSNDWRFSTSGFIETDVIQDSTESFRETIGNSPVARATTVAGDHGRSQLSIRNSRLAFNVDGPLIDDWKNRAYLELDFMGFDPATGNGNTENSFFSSPTTRVRHAFLEFHNDRWQILAGQTWGLFGWQPYYFLATTDISPVPATIYGRVAQVRGMRTFHLSEISDLQAAVALARPPQSDGGAPDLQAGVRWSCSSRQSGFVSTSSAPYKTQPMSVGLSGLVRQYRVPDSAQGVTTAAGSALALNTMVPILTSSDGKSLRGTMTLTGEFSTGRGDGDQFSQWTGGTAPQLATATTGFYKALPAKPTLDGGLGDYDDSGAFQLIQLQTYNLQLQYHLPTERQQWVTLGVGVLQSHNVDSLSQGGFASTSSGNLIYDRERVLFLNYFQNVTPQLRIGAEYAYVDTHFADGENASNNRYQVSAFYLF
jgi:hypothetical protein